MLKDVEKKKEKRPTALPFLAKCDVCIWFVTSGLSRQNISQKITSENQDSKRHRDSSYTTYIYVREKQYFLVTPCIPICTYIYILREMTTFRIITRSMKWQNIRVCCDPESREVTGCRERFPAASFLMRYETYEKIHPSLSRRGLLPFRAYLPFSNLADVTCSFCFATKGWRTCELTDFRGSAPRHRDCAPRDYIERIHPPRIRFVSGTGSNLCASVSLLVLRSLRNAYNAACHGVERRRRREVLAVVAAADVSRTESHGRRTHRWHLKYARETTAGRISLILRDDITFPELYQGIILLFSAFSSLSAEE